MVVEQVDLGPTSVGETIVQMLTYSMYDDAQQLAECWHVQCQMEDEDALYHLLLAYKHQPHSVIKICKGVEVTSARCRLMLATAHYQVNDLVAAETLLLGGSLHSTIGKDNERIVQIVKNLFSTNDTCAYALTLLAKISRDTNRRALAALLARHALEINPLLLSDMTVFAMSASTRETSEPSVSKPAPPSTKHIGAPMKSKRKEATTTSVTKESLRSDVLPKLKRMCASLFAAVTAQHRCNAQLVFAAIDTISSCLQCTPVVLLCMARIYYDCGDFVEAAKVFETLVKQFAWSTRGMGLYATTLWHLNQSNELSRLCLRMERSHRYSPETWMAIANALSLERQHERAIQALRRAIDLKPSLAFAYVLLGHEYMAVDKHQEATECFYEAKRIDATMWNAWYGLGLLKFGDEDLHSAAIYFSYALRINNSNPTIMVHNAVTLTRLGRIDAARCLYTRALDISPTHIVGRYHFAQLHYYSNDYKSCIELCEELLKDCSQESCIFKLIGKCYFNLGDKPKALLNFTLANDLQPRPEPQAYLLASDRDNKALLVVANDDTRGQSNLHVTPNIAQRISNGGSGDADNL